MQIQLTAGQTVKRSLATKSLVVLSASAPFEMWPVGLEPIQIHQGDAIPDLGEYVGRPWSIRSDTTQTIDIGVSGLYVRRATDGNVAITNSPTVGVDDSTPIDVAVTGTPAVTVSGTPSVSVSNAPTVAAITAPVSIDDSTPIDVAVTGTPAVTVSGTPSVSVSNAPTVAAITAPVSIDDSTPVAVAVAVGSAYLPTVDPAAIAADSSAEVVAANAGRLSVTIANPATNTQNKRLGVSGNVGADRGDILTPGDSKTLAVTGAIWVHNIGASAEGVTVSEVIA